MSAVTDELAFAGAARQAELLRAKQVSSRELTELYLGRIERIDVSLNAYRDVWSDSALAAAEEADRRLGAGESGPLLGVPIAIKDVLDVAGDVTKLGTDGFDRPAAEDSELVRRLRAGGAVILGKTNLPELAIHGYTESKTFGVTRTPGIPSGPAAAPAAAAAPPWPRAWRRSRTPPTAPARSAIRPPTAASSG